VAARVSRAMFSVFLQPTRLPLQEAELRAGEDCYFLWVACVGTRVASDFW